MTDQSISNTEQQPNNQTTPATPIDSVDSALHAATESLQKLAQRLTDEASPYVAKARELVDRAEGLYQDVRQNLTQKIDEQTSQNDSAREALALLKDAQQEAESALKALRHDFEQLRKMIVDVQQTSELKTYVQQLLARLTHTDDASATPADADTVASADSTSAEKPAAKPRARRKAAVKAADESAE
jgi:chromosome segregation ATPase